VNDGDACAPEILDGDECFHPPPTSSRQVKVNITSVTKGRLGGEAFMMPEWTAEENAVLRKLYYQEQIPKIARRLGRTRDAVYQRAFRMGLKNKYRRGASLCKPPVQVTEWVDSYAKVFHHACSLHSKRVPIEVRSRWVDLHSANRREEYSVFRIHPRSLKKYWAENGEE